MILPLHAMASAVIGMFSVGIDVADILYAKVDGVERQTAISKRSVSAAVDTADSASLEQIFGGSVSQGSIGIYTSEELFFTDVSPEVWRERKQSFVDYDGLRYRVLTVAKWSRQAGVNIYLAERYITQDKY